MKGLILKDFYNLRKQYKILLFLFVFYIGMSIINGDSDFLIGVISVMMVMLTVTTLSYDERSSWDKYALTMPISRSDLVFGKYVLGLILSVVAFGFNFVFKMITGSGKPAEALTASAATLGISMLFLFILLPILFKYGVEKGRLLMIAAMFTPTAIIILLANSGIKPPDENLMRYLPYLCTLVLVIFAYISIRASLSIYEKKEM